MMQTAPAHVSRGQGLLLFLVKMSRIHFTEHVISYEKNIESVEFIYVL